MSKIPIAVNNKVLTRDKNASTIVIEAHDHLQKVCHSRSEESSACGGWILNLDLRQVIHSQNLLSRGAHIIRSGLRRWNTIIKDPLFMDLRATEGSEIEYEI